MRRSRRSTPSTAPTAASAATPRPATSERLALLEDSAARPGSLRSRAVWRSGGRRGLGPSGCAGDEHRAGETPQEEPGRAAHREAGPVGEDGVERGEDCGARALGPQLREDRAGRVGEGLPVAGRAAGERVDAGAESGGEQGTGDRGAERGAELADGGLGG